MSEEKMIDESADRRRRYYNVSDGQYEFRRKVTKEEIMKVARKIVGDQFRRMSPLLNPTDTKWYLTLQLGQFEQEVFSCIFLDARHRVLGFEKLFYGTIDGASVYPREVVKRALAHNAAAVICAHNHPSGVPEPSAADQHITQRLREALALVEVRLVDHIVVGGTDALSFAERGLL